MNDSEKFEAFKRGLVRENEERYGAESRASYGDGAVDAANSAVLGMREDQHAAWTALDEAIHAALWDYAEKHHLVIPGLEKPKSDISEHDEEEEY